MKNWIVRTTAYPTRGLKVRTLVFAAVLAVIVGIFMRVSRVDVAFWKLILVAVAIVVLHRVIKNQRDPVVDAPVANPRIVNEEQMNVFSTVREWERTLAYTEKYPDLFSETSAQAKLRTLVSDRLRAKHHISLEENPEASLDIIGRPLYDFLHYPVDVGPTRDEFDKHLSRIERI